MLDQAPDKKKRTIGVTALVVIGMLAGVIVASSASGEEFATVGTIAQDNEAYALPLEDERVRFTLAGQDGAATPEARFAVYDAQDAFFGSFALEGDGDDVEILTDQAGDWVVFVSQARNAELAVEVEQADDENDSIEMDKLEVKEITHEVASQEGGSLDEEVALRLNQRPAVAFLRVDGEVTNLDASIATDKGTVFGVQDATKNETTDGIRTSSGEYILDMENLATGTYTIQAQADDLQGTLVMVHQTYDRGDRESVPDAPDVPVAEEDKAPRVLEVEEHQAGLVDTQGTDVIQIEVAKDTYGKILLYNSSDRVADIIEFDREYQDQPDWWDHEKNDTENASDTRMIDIEVDQPGEYVLFTSYLSDDDHPVIVRLPGLESADEGEILDLEEVEVTVPHDGENSTKQAELTGGLVGLHVRSHSDVAFEREITVTGPVGEVFHVSKTATVFGGGIWWDGYEVNKENFSSGLFDVTVEGDEGLNVLSSGETTVTLIHYVR